MYKKILILGLGLLSLNIFAQKEQVENLPNFDNHKFHYGFYLGLNNNGFKVAYKPSSFPNAEVDIKTNIGFNVGLIGDMRINNNVNLRLEPGLISNTKTLIFKHEQDEEREVGNTYLHVPIILKLSTDRLNNIRPYVLAGMSYDHNFSSNEKNNDDNFSRQFRQKTSNFMYEVGIGIDLYLPYFKFSPSIRGIFAINNEIISDNRSPSPYTDPIDVMNTRGVFIHLAFE